MIYEFLASIGKKKTKFSQVESFNNGYINET